MVDADDEDDDGEGEEDEGLTLGKDGRPQGPLPPYEVSDVPKPQGTVTILQGVGVYQTGSPSVVGILLVGDYWGWNGGRVRAVADYLANSLNAFVVVPRLLDTPTLQEGTDGDGLPPDFQVGSRPSDLRQWLLKYLWETFKPKIDVAVVHLRNNQVKRIAGVGFGFGAWAACQASAIVNEFVCNVLFYPEVHWMEALVDGNPHRLFHRIRGPVALMPSKDNPKMYDFDGDLFEIALKRFPNQCEHFPETNMASDWVLRGDISDKSVKASTKRSVLSGAKFARKFLWPPPPGANASTLRLGCQNGEINAVSELLSAGIPSDGKDAIDVVGLSPMHYAAKAEKNFQSIRKLVEYEADPNVSGGIAGETPLHIAASLSNAKAIKVLLQVKADPNKADKGGQTPLHYAAREGSLPCAKELIFANADLEIRDDPSQQAPLHLAAWYGKEKVCRLLLKAKAEVEPEDIRSQTPQKRAQQQGFDAMVYIFEAERQRREETALEEIAVSSPK